jgi:protein subunit release factor A
MAQEIQLQQEGFLMKVNAMENAGREIATNVDKPQITGNMPALQKYIDTYENIQKVLQAYQQLINQDAEKLKSAQEALTVAESQIIK